jgi:hypothetical protein
VAVDESARELWLGALERLVARSAHELRGPLNGIALNLEVVRSRVARSGTETASLSPFAESAADELKRATELVEALVALARPARTPVDLSEVLEPLTRLYAAIAAADGGEVTFERPAFSLTRVAADADRARAALAATLDGLVRGTARVQSSVARAGDSVQVIFQCSEQPAPPSDAIRAAVAGSIGLERSEHSVTLIFAALPGDGTGST